MMLPKTNRRVLVAKLGLDGHDRGLKVVARMLRDAGFEVIYTGLFQTAQSVVRAAVEEDVGVIGISILSGAHLTIVPRVLAALSDAGVSIPVVVGGTIPPSDVSTLRDAGVAAVLPSGVSDQDIVRVVSEAAARASPSC
jgi:methylmalonyl-CoA mutase C-terminal domain/subunit